MTTGENEQGLRKILDMTRVISIVLLGLHFYLRLLPGLCGLETNEPLD